MKALRVSKSAYFTFSIFKGQAEASGIDAVRGVKNGVREGVFFRVFRSFRGLMWRQLENLRHTTSARGVHA
jgi:hypothetical protein